MSKVEQLEAEIARLTDAEQAQLARWLQERCDPDAGLELRMETARELTDARREIERGDVADWGELKRSTPTGRQ